jgi:hypothetical protein
MRSVARIKEKGMFSHGCPASRPAGVASSPQCLLSLVGRSKHDADAPRQ